MFNYLMTVMYAIEQQQNVKLGRTQDQKSMKELSKTISTIFGEEEAIKDEKERMITIEVTPEDMKRAKTEKEKRQKEIKERKLIGKLPSRGKIPSSRN